MKKNLMMAMFAMLLVVMFGSMTAEAKELSAKDKTRALLSYGVALQDVNAGSEMDHVYKVVCCDFDDEEHRVYVWYVDMDGKFQLGTCGVVTNDDFAEALNKYQYSDEELNASKIELEIH